MICAACELLTKAKLHYYAVIMMLQSKCQNNPTYLVCNIYIYFTRPPKY